MRSRLILFALSVLLFPLASHAATLTGADLPGAGQTLTITEDTQFLIGSGETATWGGTISVGGGYTVDILNQGTIQGTCNVENSGLAEVNFRNEGTLEGNLNLNTYGVSTNFSNTGQFQGNLNALAEEGLNTIVNSGIMSGTFNLTANGASGSNQVQNTGVLTDLTANINANNGGTVDFINLNTGDLSGFILTQSNGQGDGKASTVNFLNQGDLDANFSVNNYNAQVNFQNDGTIGNSFNATNTGAGTFNFSNNGDTAEGFLMSLNTYGAYSNFANSGLFQGTLNVLDQYDTTHIFNSGTISGTFNLTANGDMGSIGIQNNGVFTDFSANINANYGGGIDWNNIFGSVDFETLAVQANGSSHGVYSSFLMLYNQDVTVEELVGYGLPDASFLAAWMSGTFEGPNGATITFNFVDNGPPSAPVPEPSTLLLLGAGLIGFCLRGAKRRMAS